MSLRAVNISALAEQVRGQSLLRIEWIRRHATSEGSPWSEAAVTPILDLVAAVGGHAAAADPVLADPRFARWADCLIHLIDRDAPTLLPDGEFTAACRGAGAFAAAIRLNARSDEPTLVRITSDGFTALPGSGHRLAVSPSLAGTLIETPGSGVPRTPEFSPLPGLALDSDHELDLEVCMRAEHLSSPPVTVVIEDGPSRPTGQSTPGIAVVPADASARERAAHVLAAAQHLTFGVAQLQRRWTELTVATCPSPEREAVSTPDQIHRLIALHVALVELEPASAGDTAEALRGLARWLADCPRTPDGDEVLRWLAAAGFAVDEAPASVELPTRPPALWRRAWVAASGRWRSGRSPEAFLTADNDGVVADLLTGLGGDRSVEVNVLDLACIRTDHSFDRLSLLAARDADRYDAFTARLGAAGSGPLATLLRGHCAYIGQRFAEALALYDELLPAHPYDIDLWRDAAFTLRHIGRYDLCDAWVFHAGSVIERAEVIEPDADVLQTVIPGFTGTDGRPSFSALLLEWVRRDLDTR